MAGGREKERQWQQWHSPFISSWPVGTLPFLLPGWSPWFYFKHWAHRTQVFCHHRRLYGSSCNCYCKSCNLFLFQNESWFEKLLEQTIDLEKWFERLWPALKWLFHLSVTHIHIHTLPTWDTWAITTKVAPSECCIYRMTCNKCNL